MRIKHLCCLFILLFALTIGSAQKIEDKHHFVENGLIDIQVGLSLPVLDFADNNYKPASGYALPGYSLKLGIRYDVAPFLGLGLHYQYFKNGFDEANYFGDLKTDYSNITINSFHSNPWTLQGVLLGMYLPFRSYHTSTDIGFAGGVLNGVYPENTLNYNSPLISGTVLNVKQYETNAAGFAMQAGVKVRHILYRNILITASADYTYTEIEYKDIKAVETNTQTYFSLEPYTQYYHIVQLAVGIGVQLK